MSSNGDEIPSEDFNHKELVIEADLREQLMSEALDEGDSRGAIALGLLVISTRLKAIDFTLNQPGNVEDDIYG